MNRTLFYIKASLGLLFFLPHIFCVYIYIYIYNFSELRDFIKQDISVNRINDKPFLLNFCVLMWNPFFNSLFFHRIKDLKIRYLLYHVKGSFYIPHDVILGKGCKLDHPFSTIINAKSIGNNFRIKNNVTIGNKNDDDSQRAIIGNNVYVGANAVIIGKIKIGDNVTVGAGATVTRDVPSNSIVVGINRILVKSE